MKLNKILLATLIISYIASANNVFAFSAFHKLFTVQGNVPAHNGSISWEHTSDDLYAQGTYGYEGQAVSNVSVSPTTDTLDIILYVTNQLGVTTNQGWKILENGKETILGFGLIYGFPPGSYSYKLKVDSRWYYTKATAMKADWGYYNGSANS